MKKVSLSLLLSISISFASIDFSKCQEIISLSLYPIGKHYGIALKEGVIFYSTTRPQNVQILRYDPYLNLYLITPNKETKPLELSTDYNFLDEKIFVSIDKNITREGRIVSLGGGYELSAIFSASTPQNSVITDICYRVYGIGIGGNEFIESYYIRNFLDGNIKHLDLGVSLDSSLNVINLNPFFSNNPFKLGDKIIKIDDIQVTNLKNYLRILASKNGNSVINITILRDGKNKKVNVAPKIISSRYQKSAESYMGITLSEDLKIVTTTQNKYAKDFKIGDRILAIDGKNIENKNEFKKALSNAYKDKISFLLYRDGFSFFVKIDNLRDTNDW